MHGTLSDPTPQEQDFLNFKSSVGCLADERAFYIATKSYVGKRKPNELVSFSGWHFSRDKGGESGFIGFGNSPSKTAATWELPCGGQRQILDIGYLRSYENMGAVKVDVEREGNPTGTTVILDGLWISPASVEVFEVVRIPDGNGMVRVSFEVLSADTEGYYPEVLSKDDVATRGVDIDTARADRKFKVTMLQCC